MSNHWILWVPHFWTTAAGVFFLFHSREPTESSEQTPGFQEAPPSKAIDCVGRGRAHCIPKGTATRPTETKTSDSPTGEG